MKLKHKRLTFVFISIGLFSIAVILILNAFEENIVFFYSPSDLNDKKIARDQKVRIGGLVEKGSVKRLDDGNISFTITDLKSSIDVKFTINFNIFLSIKKFCPRLFFALITYYLKILKLLLNFVD